MAPIIMECQKRKIKPIIIHTNQHYSRDMDKIFFDELKLPGAVIDQKHLDQQGRTAEKIDIGANRAVDQNILGGYQHGQGNSHHQPDKKGQGHQLGRVPEAFQVDSQIFRDYR